MASIFLRGRVWWILYYQSGKKVTYSLKTRDKTVAKYRKNEIENQLTKGDSPLPNDSITPQTALSEYLQDCSPRVTPMTLRHYRAYVGGFLRDIYDLRHITEERVSKYTAAKSKTTAHHIIRYIVSFINFCIKRNYLKENPLKNIRRPRLEQVKHRFLSQEEIKAVLTNAGELKAYLTFAVYTGMRPSELLRLRWKDIDAENDLIIVQKSKTSKARAIPIHPEIKMLHLAKSGEFVFDLTNLKKRFRRVKEIVGISDINLYTFRHTFASQLIMAGADLVSVKNLMGHARIETTMIYSHLSDQHLKDAVKRLHF